MTHKPKGKTKPEANYTDHHQALTNRIIELMEQSKASNWEKPWLGATELPYNPCTGTRYSGINAISLMAAGFTDPRFMTYVNAKEMAEKEKREIRVKAGAKGITIFRAIQVRFGSKDADDECPDSSSAGCSRSFWKNVYSGVVFNYSQLDGAPPLPPVNSDFQPQEEAELLGKALTALDGLTITHHGLDSAHYSPKGHIVALPDPKQFSSTTAYYDTLLHEFAHSTASSCGRPLTGDKSKPEYAFEELVAELCSIFVSSAIGIPHDPRSHENHAKYLNGWLASLLSDKTYIFKAASQAAKACKFQLDLLETFKADIQPACQPKSTARKTAKI